MPVPSDTFLSLFKALPVGAVLFDPADDGFVEFNDSACRQLGYTREEFARLRVGDVDLLRTGAEIQAARKALVSDASPQRFRTRQRAANGSIREVEVMIQSVVLNQRRLGYAVWQDVTEQEQALAALRDRESELARVQRIGRVGGFEVDLINGFDKQRSPEYVKLHGLPADAIVEPHDAWVRRLHPDDRERSDRAFRDAVAGNGVAYASEYRVITPEGEIRWISAVGEIERDPHGRPLRMVGAHIDVTALKNAESALAEHAIRLQESDRRKDEFLAMLGHELRNPLAAILAVSERLKRSAAALPAEIVLAHQVIDRNAGHLRVIVDDLLDVARVQTGKIVLNCEVIDIATVVRLAAEQTADLTARNFLRREIVLPHEAVYVEADTSRMIQVVSNLLNNAAKFTHPGGHIRLLVAADAVEVSVTVEDSGIGIAQDLLPHVFELFVQSKPSIDRSSGGLGIGLTLAREIIQLHGGRITARSEGPGAGSVFCICLPRSPAPPQAPAAPEFAAKVDPATARRRVLVVDDNVDAAEALAALLRFDGHSVETLHDGSLVLDHVRHFQPQVVLLDLGLPGRDGFELARELRGSPQSRDLVIVALTGYGQDEDRRKTRACGFDQHFVKPIEFERLSEFIDSLAVR